MSKVNTKMKIPSGRLKRFIKDALFKARVREDVAGHVAEGLVQTSLRGVDSHGVRLLPHYLKGLKGGRINPNPNYKFKRTSPSTGTLDADHTFGHASGIEGAKRAVELAGEAGTGHVAIYNSSHFGAAAYYALEIAKHDMIGMSFTNTDALVKSYGGKKAFLGNNPICFTAPMHGEEPFCLDMATSVLTFNKIQQLKEEGLEAPRGVGADADGIENTDPGKIKTLLPIGGYKGYGLSLMVEILCSLLTGMPYGVHIPKMFEAPMSEKRFLGHFVCAIRIDCFQDTEVFKKRLSEVTKELRSEPSLEEDRPIQVAGDPEKKCKDNRRKNGIPISFVEYQAFERIDKEYDLGLFREAEQNV